MYIATIESTNVHHFQLNFFHFEDDGDEDVEMIFCWLCKHEIYQRANQKSEWCGNKNKNECGTKSCDSLWLHNFIFLISKNIDNHCDKIVSE